jgi:exodeoxyribonuclease III
LARREQLPAAAIYHQPMRIVSWNVNGLRACAREAFPRLLRESAADVIGVQEVRALPQQLDAETRAPAGWYAHFAPGGPGYSGVAIYSRQEPDEVTVGIGERRFDVEGRLITARFGKTFVVNGYFPKGNGTKRDNSRVPYKLAFYMAVFERVQQLRRRGAVFVIGDFNTAREEIDLARPKENAKSSGFLPEERAAFALWIDAGWVDTFRSQHPGEIGHYTWWRQWGGARERNVGWRIDYVLASPSAANRVANAFIWQTVRGSDHAPVGVDVV